jgi:hypothetical protein
LKKVVGRVAQRRLQGRLRTRGDQPQYLRGNDGKPFVLSVILDDAHHGETGSRPSRAALSTVTLLAHA